LFKNQIISGDNSKNAHSLMRSAALFTEIIPRASTRQGLAHSDSNKAQINSRASIRFNFFFGGGSIDSNLQKDFY